MSRDQCEALCEDMVSCMLGSMQRLNARVAFLEHGDTAAQPASSSGIGLERHDDATDPTVEWTMPAACAGLDSHHDAPCF